ncbi:MAG TPA: adenylate/guanylate cyclase domain-containing protein [Chthoniobacterales bacterium]
MADFPTGNVTFLFTDIEGSSRMWERYPVAMGGALANHDRILRESIKLNEGLVFKTVGDAFCVVFNEAPGAIAAAAAAQKRLAESTWETPDPIKVRMAVHTGVAELRDNDYFGQTLNRVARILAAGNGGQTLLSRVTEELVNGLLPDGVSLRDLGERRLKDLTRSERIFEVIIEGLPDEFPPLRSLERFPNNLPVQLTSFVGREAEQLEVRRLLDTTHLLTLTGPGGTGKTRLSLQVAADVLEHYPDGVWLVELAQMSDPEKLAETVANVLGVMGDGDRQPEAVLASFLRRKNMLLIFDNCEHLVVPVAMLATELLQAAPNLRILASSRTPLSIMGETTWPVPPLSTPQRTRWGDLPYYTVEQAVSFESVKLFMDRALAVNPRFQLTPENIRAVTQICYRLDGIPLAIELAAARVKFLPPQQIASRLDDRFQLLTGGSRSALPRQQTLRALIDWSHDLLSEKERILFRRLAVFVGGRTLETVEAVCSGEEIEDWEVLDLLSQLLDKSLITIEEGPQGEPRYVMTESVWQYATAKFAESTDGDVTRDRHLAYFTKKAEKAAPFLWGPDQAHWLEKLSPERYNFRAAMDWGIASKQPKGLELAMRMAVALARFWEVRSDLKEGREHTDALLAEVSRAPRTLLLAETILVGSRLAWCQDDTKVARAYAVESLEIFRELKADVHVGFSLAILGFIERLEDSVDAAEAYFKETMAIAEKTGDLELRSLALSGMGSIAGDRKDYAAAARLKQQSVEICRQLGDRYLLELNTWSLGRLAFLAGRTDEAFAFFRECAATAVELANRWIIPHLVENIGAICRVRGQFETGTRLFGAASVMRERLGLNFVPLEMEQYDREVATLREGVSDLARFTELWEAGRMMDPSMALEMAFPGLMKKVKGEQ